MTHWLWLGAAAHAAPEWCNGVDDDLDGAIDEAPLTRYTVDADGDGFGAPGAVAATPDCLLTVGFWDEPDCDDADSTAAPGETEDSDYDGSDDDCDGLVDDLPALPADTQAAWDDDSTFVFADLDDDFDGALAWCGERGYQLASIHDAVENQLVLDAIAPLSFSTDLFWLGMRRTDGTQPFTWTDGTPYDFDDLTVQAGPRNCVLADGDAGDWRNARCTDPHGYVCELACAVDARFADADLDGFGDPNAPVAACAGEGVADNDDDCDDLDPTDNLRLWYEDNDGDGAGDPNTWVATCTAPGTSVANGDDCDDLDETVTSVTVWYADLDGDEFGTDPVHTGCGPPPDTTRTPGDCDDAEPTAFPGGIEVCDPQDVDEDCDGAGDPPGAPGSAPYWPDADGDGFGDGSLPPIGLCDPIDGYVGNGEDCLDADFNVHPGAVEQCNGRDDDCDDTTPDSTEDVPWWPDADGDLWGDADADPVEACSAPSEQHVPVGRDCDDANADVHPEAADPPSDGVDQDCDGEDGSSTEPTDTGRPPMGPPGADRPAGSPQDSDVGCGCAGGAAPRGWWFAAVLLLALRRR
ncbi:MAG: MopE-related protein [Myxococcota bacterium]